MLLQELDPPEPLPLNRNDLTLPSLVLRARPGTTERFGLAGPSGAPPAPEEPLTRTAPSRAQLPGVEPPAPLPDAPEPPAVPQVVRSSPASLPTALPGVRRILLAPDAQLTESPRKRRKHRWLPWLLVVLLLELVAGAGVVAASRLVWNHDTVPQIVGLRVTAAEAAVRKTGLTPEVSGEQFSARVARGEVISQLPRSGTPKRARP